MQMSVKLNVYVVVAFYTTQHNIIVIINVVVCDGSFFYVFAQSRKFVAFTQGFNENETRTIKKLQQQKNGVSFFLVAINQMIFYEVYVCEVYKRI